MFLFLLACSTKSTDSSANNSTDSALPDSPVECADLSADECEANECSLVSGRPASESADGSTCIDWNTDPQPAGCSAYESALTVLSFAQSPDGVCWAFPSGTVPDGWPECASVDECECADFSLDECEANNCNLLSGRPATEKDDGTTCIDWSIDPQPAGCTSENSSEAVVSFAQAPDGVCWFFPSGTVPAGWPECPYVDECE